MNNQKKTLKLDWDEEGAAVYIYLGGEKREDFVYGKEINPDVIVVYSRDGDMVGINFLNIHTFILGGEEDAS